MKHEIIIKIQELRSKGKSYGDIARQLLITKSQACYFSKIDLNERKEKLNDKFSFEEKICELAKKCENINQICKIIGKKSTNENYKRIKNILQINNVDIPHFNQNISNNSSSAKKDVKYYLVSGSTIAISKLRERIIKNGIKEHKCEKCGRTEWEGEQIPLELHHINGDRLDNRIENLQLLCPNCHTLTDNYCGKKLKKEPNKCRLCGKEISRNSSYCVECYHKTMKKKYHSYKNGLTHPSKDELIDDFRKLHSFSAVGRKYGVSDKAIVKWCESYLLPTTKQSIKNYILGVGREV